MSQPRKRPKVTESSLASGALAILKFYHDQLSGLFPAACRFTPTCSEYMADAIRKYGLRSGFWKGCKRLLRCHPFHPGGFDPA